MSNLQLTSVSSSTEFLPRADAGLGPRQSMSMRKTATAEIHSFEQAERSHTLEELQQHPVFGSLWRVPQPEAPNPLEATRDHRLAILAREFEGAELTREDEARLAILTQRLRNLAPKVTSKAWTIAEEALAKLEGVAVRIDEIDAKYGL